MAADASMPGRPPGLEASDSTERAGVDGESADWLARLRSADTARHEAITQLHDMLVRIARREVGRRADQSRISGPELDDIAYQAAADPLLALLGKLDEFRGDSRFTTWAYKFVMFEVSAKVGRHFLARSAGTPGRRRLGTIARPALFGAVPRSRVA
jgi:RNA polymerase sigma-70 factor (ECF subfamily)